MSVDLTGKAVLISGTAGALGRAAALLFAERGALVAGCDLDDEGNEQTASSYGGRAAR